MTRIRKRLLVLFLCIFIAVVAISLINLIPKQITVTLHDGALAEVRLAPYLKALLCETSCEISYRPKNGNIETVVLLQDSDSQPAMIIPSQDGKTFMCLYYADVVYRLLKVDPTKRAMPFPDKSYLKYIVLSSSCDIQAATTNDWLEVSNYLKSNSQDSLKSQTFGFRKSVLSSGVQEQIWNIEHGFAHIQ